MVRTYYLFSNLRAIFRFLYQSSKLGPVRVTFEIKGNKPESEPVPDGSIGCDGGGGGGRGVPVADIFLILFERDNFN